MALLVILFFLTALLYASIGFGGGSTYNALLVLANVDYRILPSIALVCNIIVVAGGVWRFAAAGLLDWRRLAPWLAGSMPAAWIGGRLPVSETFFIGVLGFALCAAGLLLLIDRVPDKAARREKTPTLLGVTGGAALGLVAGVAGIGGGIFLAPALHFLRWGGARQIAAACSLFILLNSGAGLAGQIGKLAASDAAMGAFAAYWPLAPAVLVGGQIGSRLAAGPLPAKWMKRLTALLILYVALRLLLRWGAMIAA